MMAACERRTSMKEKTCVNVLGIWDLMVLINMVTHHYILYITFLYLLPKRCVLYCFYHRTHFSQYSNPETAITFLISSTVLTTPRHHHYFLPQPRELSPGVPVFHTTQSEGKILCYIIFLPNLSPFPAIHPVDIYFSGPTIPSSNYIFFFYNATPSSRPH